MGLVPSQRLTPYLQQALTRLATWLPFAKASDLLQSFWQVEVSPPTTWRQSEGVGRSCEAVQLQQLEQLEQDPTSTSWARADQALTERLVGSVDGAMVPLVKGEWAEVKTLVIGEVGQRQNKEGQSEVYSHNLSYFSRLAEAQEFGRKATVETERRGLSSVKQVAMVADGAEWIQGFSDLHCPKAVRILDFPHAAQRVAQIGEAVFGGGSKAGQQWREAQLKELKHNGPASVLADIKGLQALRPDLEVIEENLKYLSKREAQLNYPLYQVQGWPIGSGIVESANKLVVEARLKGAGMHWERANVNPMLVLRNAECSGRWEEMWKAVGSYRIRQVEQKRARRREEGVNQNQKVVAEKGVVAVAVAVAKQRPGAGRSEVAAREKLVAQVEGKWRPTPQHPWKRYPFKPKQLA